MDSLIHVANGIYLASYTVRDILYLRILTLAATSCLAVYFASRPQPLIEVVCWNLLFLGMNAIQIGRLLWQRHARRRPAIAPLDQAGAMA